MASSKKILKFHFNLFIIILFYQYAQLRPDVNHEEKVYYIRSYFIFKIWICDHYIIHNNNFIIASKLPLTNINLNIIKIFTFSMFCCASFFSEDVFLEGYHGKASYHLWVIHGYGMQRMWHQDMASKNQARRRVRKYK